MKGGNFVGPDGTPLPGQDEIKALLHRCWTWTEIVLERYVLVVGEQSFANTLTARERLTSDSGISMNDWWKSETNWTGCL